MSQRVLLTGANGFLGSHILSQLLEQGHSVRAIVRSQSKADQILRDFSAHASQLDFHLVPDMTINGAFDEAVQSTPPFDLVIHTASPYLFSAVSKNSDLIDPPVKGTVNLLQSVKDHAPTVRRIVYTGSTAANINFFIPPVSTPRKIYTEEDWNPVTKQQALETDGYTAYRGGKTFAEQEAWKFLDTKPNFDLVVLCPPLIYGPIRHTVKSVKDLNESNLGFYNSFVNSKKDAPLPSVGFHVYVDVRDLAAAHVLAAFSTDPAVANQRFNVSAADIPEQFICDMLRANIPELGERTPLGQPGKDNLEEGIYGISNEKAGRLLGVRYRSKEETFVELARQLLELEKREKA